MSLIDKIKKNSTIKESSILADSKFFNEKDMIPTMVPALNIALSAKIDGGLSPGLTQWCGESARFKSLFCLLMAKSYLDKYPDAALLFYDSEFGSPKGYWEKLGIDQRRVIHTPLTDIEQLTFDCMNQLNNIERGEKLFIVIDSIGNLASKREVDNSLAEKGTEDLSRPKKLKSLFRMVTPHLNIKNIPMHVVNHVYKELSLYGKDIVAGGQGSYLSSDNIYIIGKQQEKDGTELIGYNFVINVEKSRYVVPRSKIPITVSFEKGISKYSGLLEIALDLGFCVKPSMGWYSRIDPETGVVEDKKYRVKDTNTKDFWEPLLTSQKFKDAVYNKYSISSHSIMSDDTDYLDVDEDEKVIEDIKS